MPRESIALGLLVLLAWSSADAQESTPMPQQIAVKVTGEVQQRGRYLLPVGSTVVDALAAAHGPTQDANPKRIQFYHLPTGEGPPARESINVRPMLDGTQPAPVLNNGDWLIVGKRLIIGRF